VNDRSNCVPVAPKFNADPASLTAFHTNRGPVLRQSDKKRAEVLAACSEVSSQILVDGLRKPIESRTAHEFFKRALLGNELKNPLLDANVGYEQT
jgi:hypothetical protein